MSNGPQLFSIGEFSQICGLSVKALRFYDEKGLLKPAEVDASTGYRYYDGDSVERARVIARLRELQFSLDDIAGILAECGDDADLLASLERQRRGIEARIRADRKISRALEEMINAERNAARLASDRSASVQEKSLEPVLVAGLRMKGRYEECGAGFSAIARGMGRHLAGPPFCLYYDGEYREEDADFEPCFPLRREGPAPDGIQVRTLPAIRALSLVHQGPYQQLGRSYKKLLSHAKSLGVTVVQPTREVYLKGPGTIFKGDPARYITEIHLPLRSS